MPPMVKIELRVRGFAKLAQYLADHESDIANDENDFGDLRDLYVAVYEEEPKK